MLEFKTRFTTISIGEEIIIERKGMNSFNDKISWVLLTAWVVDADEIFLRVGAYSVTVRVNSNKEIIELIRKVLRNPKDMENTVSIKANNIKIEE